MPQPPDSLTQALDDWMDRILESNPNVRVELLTEAELQDLYTTLRKLCRED